MMYLIVLFAVFTALWVKITLFWDVGLFVNRDLLLTFSRNLMLPSSRYLYVE
jgi:hypothetical protein